MAEKKNLAEILVGRKTELRRMPYTKRDISLYAIAVGAKPEDLIYTYDKGMKVIPTFGTLPCWAALGVEPHLDLPFPASMYTMDHVDVKKTYLHMDHEIVMHRPIDVDGEELVWQDEITDVYDRGEGKGIAVRSECAVTDKTGEPLCTNRFSTFFFEGGGFGGNPMPKSDVTIPERDPDETEEDYVGPVQNMLYRLTGDTNLVHSDPEYARKVGLDRPIMQGLCTFGYAARMIIEKMIPGKPENMKRMAARMTGIVYPGSTLRLSIWKEREGAVLFRMAAKEQSGGGGEMVVLDKGVFEFTD